MNVHCHWPFSLHEHVLHPSSAFRDAPGTHPVVPPSGGKQAFSVHAHEPSEQVHVLHPSSAGAVWLPAQGVPGVTGWVLPPVS
jgi:hypothetical protein